ncbi:tRNA (5-methylaminomethyl-2-thiouridine)(34)-methyltransferase MnmD [Pseudooceanicola sp.]|uniref:tRNA (5-methylaminomethyl-2-thiouridine)(34)-methyltransferase MnmD n=1 Tax=Pseudooceanicola sp. TaxID=1914328 RepID=UPI002623E8E6|nr:tRNA (5-methylaminomethyl-2-thiouridine)(34)-methyltransferase MnmD [Pseudooceanicola sp.]MDF1856917.1 tRNA (5-methylaminomethyl-2-thiouridine)(34)-methyltransferase MnmD [Pseudooceanicola sp.]
MAELTWQEGDVPVSTRFDDPYFSLDNGLDETRHVFLAGNDLPSGFRDGFHIAELGFGTGLNFLTTLAAWRATGRPGRLRYSAFEAYPMPAPDVARALSAFPALSAEAMELVAIWPALLAEGAVALPGVDLQLIPGDARASLPAWSGVADAWYLDGFAPAKNPELWGEALMAEVFAHTAPGGSAATYTAAGFVRRGLAAAGFTVSRLPGYGRKRHMTRAERP